MRIDLFILRGDFVADRAVVSNKSAAAAAAADSQFCAAAPDVRLNVDIIVVVDLIIFNVAVYS